VGTSSPLTFISDEIKTEVKDKRFFVVEDNGIAFLVISLDGGKLLRQQYAIEVFGGPRTTLGTAWKMVRRIRQNRDVVSCLS
jgi:hypothetical protein